MSDRQSLTAIRQLEKTDGAEAAEKALIALIRNEPENQTAYGALARILMRQKKFDYAVRAADRAAAMAPMEAEPAVLAGFARMRAGDRPGAAVAFRDALAIDSSSARAMLGAAVLKMADENYDDALELCERAVEADPSLERAQQLIVRINMKQGRSDEALAELRGLVDSGRANQRAMRSYVRLMRDNGRLEEAIQHAAQLAGGGSLSRARFSRIAAMSGKPDLAIEEYRRLMDNGDARVSDLLRYVTLLIRAGDTEEARKAIGSLPDRAVLKPFRQKLLGDVARAEGKPDAALVHFRKACKLARIDGPAEMPAGSSVEDQAAAWAKHAGQAVRNALRTRRDDRKTADDAS